MTTNAQSVWMADGGNGIGLYVSRVPGIGWFWHLTTDDGEKIRGSIEPCWETRAMDECKSMARTMGSDKVIVWRRHPEERLRRLRDYCLRRIMRAVPNPWRDPWRVSRQMDVLEFSDCAALGRLPPGPGLASWPWWRPSSGTSWWSAVHDECVRRLGVPS